MTRLARMAAAPALMWRKKTGVWPALISSLLGLAWSRPVRGEGPVEPLAKTHPPSANATSNSSDSASDATTVASQGKILLLSPNPHRALSIRVARELRELGPVIVSEWSAGRELSPEALQSMVRRHRASAVVRVLRGAEAAVWTPSAEDHELESHGVIRGDGPDPAEEVALKVVELLRATFLLLEQKSPGAEAIADPPTAPAATRAMIARPVSPSREGVAKKPSNGSQGDRFSWFWLLPSRVGFGVVAGPAFFGFPATLGGRAALYWRCDRVWELEVEATRSMVVGELLGNSFWGGERLSTDASVTTLEVGPRWLVQSGPFTYRMGAGFSGIRVRVSGSAVSPFRVNSPWAVTGGMHAKAGLGWSPGAHFRIVLEVVGTVTPMPLTIQVPDIPNANMESSLSSRATWGPFQGQGQLGVEYGGF